jgi:hypothetical protein
MAPVLATIEVVPVDANVALLDRTWQDYPEWKLLTRRPLTERNR